MTQSWFRWAGDTLLLDVGIQPGASRTEVVGPHGNRLKVRVTAAPVEGAANAHLVKLLAREFRVPKTQVQLVRGQRIREKRVAVRAPKSHPLWLPQS